ncbi:MAG: hypothetical protein HY663_05665 [Chloroflexi bacterium]|nr:hypothetical protein [Chloroflexota bacterium]
MKKKILYLVIAAVLAVMPAAVLAADLTSPANFTTTGANTLAWSGQGATNGVLNTIKCQVPDDPFGADQPYLHWIFTTDQDTVTANQGTTPQLTLGGTGSGTYDYTEHTGNAFHFVTPYFTPNNALTAVVSFITTNAGGNGQYLLVISHGCPGAGNGGVQEIATLDVVKFYDANANGVKDAGEPALTGWKVNVNGSDNTTPVSGVSLPPGTYNVSEYQSIFGNWTASGITVTGTSTYTIISNTSVNVTLKDKDAVTVYFGNYCLDGSGGKTLGFWSNKNGQSTMNDGGTVAPELALLSSRNLRNADGSNFDPATYAAFRTWILSATATNMAYMLSAQLAAMELNVEAGLVNPNDFYIPAGMTIGQIMTNANTALLDGSTPAGDEPNRGNQTTLKNYLDALNNGAQVVPANPCPFQF